MAKTEDGFKSLQKLEDGQLFTWRLLFRLAKLHKISAEIRAPGINRVLERVIPPDKSVLAEPLQANHSDFWYG